MTMETKTYDPGGLIAGDYPLAHRAGTIAESEALIRGTVLGRRSVGTASSAAKAGGNTGNGTFVLDGTTPVRAGAKPGVYTLRCIAAASNAGTFALMDPEGFALGQYAITGGSGGTNTNTLLATIVSLDPIYFEFTYDEASYLRYQRMAKEMGDKADSISVKLGLIDEKGFPHSGTLDFVDNRISEDTGTIRGRATFANPDGTFTPGMFGRIQIPSAAPHEAVLVPDVAIGTEQTRKFVYVMQPGDQPQAPQMKYVTLGRTYDGQRVINSGLTKDDLVVVNGLMRIRPGAQVVGKMEAPAATPAAGAGAAADGKAADGKASTTTTAN